MHGLLNYGIQRICHRVHFFIISLGSFQHLAKSSSFFILILIMTHDPNFVNAWMDLCFFVLFSADDMLLLSLSKARLDKVLAICYKHSCKWWYDYVLIKCSVIVFIETKFLYDRQIGQWKKEPNVINDDTNHKHLDVNCNKYLNIDIN